MKKYLETGKIINVHGLDGTVKVECWADDVSVVTGLKKIYLDENGEDAREVLHSTYQKQFALLRIEGVSDRDQAAAMRGRVIYADRDDIPTGEGDHFIADLIGLSVIDASTGQTYGTVKDIYSRGAQDIYEISGEDGKTYLMPAVKEFIDRIDTGSGVYVTPIPGLFDDRSVNG